MCNVFDKLMTACIVGLAIAAAFVSFNNVSALNAINSAQAQAAATDVVAQK